MSFSASPFLHRQFRSVNFEHRAGKRETVFGLKRGGNEIWSTDLRLIQRSAPPTERFTSAKWPDSKGNKALTKSSAPAATFGHATAWGTVMKSGALLIALACVAAPEVASARQDIRLDRQMFVERVSTDINGRARRVLESADRAGAGDQLIFVVNCRKNSTP